MMKSAESRSRGDFRGSRKLRCELSPLECIADHRVNTLLVAVFDVLAEEPTEMSLVENDHVFRVDLASLSPFV
jgi:hypothetical protein